MASESFKDMSFPSRESNPQNSAMDFIETAQYNAPPPGRSRYDALVHPPLSSLTNNHNSQAPIPHPWRQYRHPIGDIYYYNPQLRLITPDNIRNPQVLEYVLDAREDHLQCLAGDPNLHRLPSDYELIISDVSESTAVIRMYSRAAGQAYTWTEGQGERQWIYFESRQVPQLTLFFLALCRIGSEVERALLVPCR